MSEIALDDLPRGNEFIVGHVTPTAVVTYTAQDGSQQSMTITGTRAYDVQRIGCDVLRILEAAARQRVSPTHPY